MGGCQAWSPSQGVEIEHQTMPARFGDVTLCHVSNDWIPDMAGVLKAMLMTMIGVPDMAGVLEE